MNQTVEMYIIAARLPIGVGVLISRTHAAAITDADDLGIRIKERERAASGGRFMMEDQQKSQVPQDFSSSSSSCCYLRDSPLLSFSYVHEYASCCSLHHRLIVDQMVDRCQAKPSRCLRLSF